MTLRYAVGFEKGKPLAKGYTITKYHGIAAAKWASGAMARFYDDGINDGPQDAAFEAAPITLPDVAVNETALPIKRHWPIPLPPPDLMETEPLPVEKTLGRLRFVRQGVKWDFWPILTFYAWPSGWLLEFCFLNWAVILEQEE